MEMIDKYLDNSIKTSEEQIEVEETRVQQEVMFDEEPDDIVSNRFELFKPEKRRRFSDMMEDDEDEYEEVEENEYNYNEMVGLLNNKQTKKQTPVKEMRIPNELNKIQDIKLRGLLSMEREDAEFTLSQELATGQVNFKDYGYYMSKIEEYYDRQQVEEEPEELSTIEEVVKVKQQARKEENKTPVQTEDPYDNFDYYDEMMSIVSEEKEEFIQPPVDEVEDEVEDIPMDNKMNQMMQSLLEMDDYDEGDMYPEDFLANNLSNLGFDEEDSEEDIQAYDAVLENIRKGNNVDLDELEDMIDDEEEYNSEEDYIATLEVFDPTVKESKVEDVKDEQENVIRLEEENKPADNIFKVRRNNNSTEITMTNVSNFEVKRNNNEEVQLKVNEINDDADDSLMSKVFRQMQETGILHTGTVDEDDEE
jgi:hypothetical protein